MVLLGGCDLVQLVVPPPPPPPPPPIRQTVEKPLPDATVRLVPLPTPQQVVTSSSLGRRNPFAPVVSPTILLPQGVAPGSEPATAVTKVARAGGTTAAQQLALQAALKVQAEAASKTGSGKDPGAAAGPVGGPTRPVVLQAPPNLLLTGVLQSNGQTEAVVTYGSQSGTLRVGDRGALTTALLPAGWSVVSIHLGGRGLNDAPNLRLQHGRQQVTVKL
jgi:hypothetical protein